MNLALSDSQLSLVLNRYPIQQKSNLQAWDAADEHVLKTLHESEFDTDKILIVNDGFGALTCGVKTLYPDSEICFEADNKTSHLGLMSNLADNNLSNKIERIDSEAELPFIPQLVLLKLPKSLVYLNHLLTRLSTILPEGTPLLIGGKAKSINKSIVEQINKFYGDADPSLTWKKTRVIHCVFDGVKRDLLKTTNWTLPNTELSISNKSNVFAASKLDVGARIMLENMPKGDFKNIVDLGCGNGVLGLRAAQLFPEANVCFVDDSAMAVSSAQQNWIDNGFAEQQGQFIWDDCLTHLPEYTEVDLILCNPPFHQGEAITDHIAWQMFVDARKKLSNGGVLHVVGNRHLAYHAKLKRLFGNCELVASNGKFVILQSVKR
ncbi:methyltransferase [Shewanella sp. 202IG2-18]|uniref:methyltransferase n=1 Tax=Parashewanella hymeniacidonis TaxID=2807618 RepID=UPI001961D919|nr:methyltransferase [Parashewanella hymeniacidonis]MBM7074485.1 methyltransferase [Parashewanella hymeniacidonis]